MCSAFTLKLSLCLLPTTLQGIDTIVLFVNPIYSIFEKESDCFYVILGNVRHHMLNIYDFST